MIGIITSKTIDRYSRPPLGAWVLNRNSPQYLSLAAFWPLLDSHGTEQNVKNGPFSDDFYTLLPVNGPIPWEPASEGIIGSRKFTGSSSQVLRKNTVTPASAVPLTFSIWSNIRDTGGGVVMSSCNDVGDNDWFRLIHNSSGSVTIDANGGGFETTTTTTGSDDKWVLCTGVFRTATDRSAYRDGSNRANSSGGTSITPGGLNRFSLGALDRPTATGHYTGLLAHGCVWNRSLTDSEIWDLYDPRTRWDLYYPIGRKIWSFAQRIIQPSIGFRTRLINRSRIINSSMDKTFIN